MMLCLYFKENKPEVSSHYQQREREPRKGEEKRRTDRERKREGREERREERGREGKIRRR